MRIKPWDTIICRKDRLGFDEPTLTLGKKYIVYAVTPYNSVSDFYIEVVDDMGKLKHFNVRNFFKPFKQYEI